MPKLKRQKSKSDTEVERLKDVDIQRLEKLNKDIADYLKKNGDHEKIWKKIKNNNT